MDRLDAMEAFVAVADLKGFAAAARRLKVSPPTVTRLISSLEGHLGVGLFHRTTRKVALTDAGTRYLSQVRDILHAVGQADRSAEADRPTPAGRFVVTAPVVFGRLEVAPVLSKFLARYPAVRAELLLLDRVVNLVDEGVDLAVRIGALDDSGLTVRTLGATRRVVVASPGYLKRNGRPRGLDELKRHSTIQLSPLAAQGAWTFRARGQTKRVPLQPALVTNSADAAIEHAVRDGGLAMVLAYQVAAQLRAKRLELVLERFEPEPRPIQLVWPASRHLSANVRAFVDVAVELASWRFVELGQ